jgi:hypothetical protein
VVVEEIDGVVQEVPVPKDEPPVGTEYQLIVPAEAVAPIVTVPVPQRELEVVPVIIGDMFTVAVTAVLGVDVHPTEAST